MIARRLALAGAWIFTTAAIFTVPFFFPAHAEEPVKEEPKKDEPKKEKEEKPKGPEHNVTLNEEEEVARLLAKAKAAREKAEKDPEAWPDCVKAYSDILAKHPNTVFLARWSGDNQEDSRAWGQGVYRSTAEKVAEELASLPEAAQRIYRAVNDGAAQALMVEAQSSQNEAPMEKVAQTYFTTSWGDDALLWLGEMAYDRGADRQAQSRWSKIEKHPDASVSKTALLARIALASAKSGLREEAQKAYDKLTEALKDPKNGELRIGHESGAAALAALKTRLEAAPAPAVAAKEDPSAGWSTYFGNAAHHQPLANKDNIGVRKWSEPLAKLFGQQDTSSEAAIKKVRSMDGTIQPVALPNYFLTARGAYFFLTSGQVVSCHNINNPSKPVFFHPSPPPQNRGPSPQERQYGQNMGLLWHPHFVTIGPEHIFVTLGPDALVIMPQWFGGNPPKQNPNWIVCLGKKKGGTAGVESGSLAWSLEPGQDRVNSKADQEWLKGMRIASSPTYTGGTLYALAVSDAGANRESWCVAFEADSGRLLWKTKICEAQPVFFGGPFQADHALPVAVHGGTVYCVTNLGAVAALEAATGGVRWIRVYDRMATNNEQGGRFGNMGVSRDLWAPNPPIVIDDLLICTPQDSDVLYAFDTLTGRRRWQTDRVSDAGVDAPGDAERLKYVMGVSHNKWLVVVGKSLVFIEAKGGRRELKALVPEEDAGKVVGTGLVTDTTIWVPTEKQLLRIDATLSAKGKPKAKILPRIEWTDPKADPGNLTMVNDVVFSVSPSHVCAYFVWEDLEKKLLDRLAANPDDLAAYLELGDGYHVVKAYPKAIEAFSKGLEAAARKGNDTLTQQQDFKARRFEAYFAEGRFAESLNVAATPEQSVRALWKMAEGHVTAKQDAEAVMLYQRMLAEFGGTVLTFDAKNVSKAAIFAQRAIGEIKERNKDALTQLETLARAALDKAATARDARALEQFIVTYPNAEAYGDGLLALANLYLDKGEGDNARQYYQRFLFGFRNSPQTAEVMARLALAYEKAGMTGSSKSTLLKLTRNPALGDQQISPPGAAAQKAAAWAGEKLKEPAYQKPATNAVRRLGSGKLTEQWSKPMANTATALNPGGKLPADMSRNIVLLENNEVVVRSGASGEELWLPRPKVPNGFMAGPQSRCAWADDLLIVAGRNELAALDGKQAGKDAWRITLGGSPETGGGQITALSAADRRVLVAQQGGMLTVLDASAGKEAWKIQVDGGQIFGQPSLGEGYVAVAVTNPAPHKVIVYEVETGLRRLSIEIPGGKIVQGPVAVDEAIYAVSSDNKARAFSAVDGKELWSFDLEAPAQRLQADADSVLVVLNNLTVVMLDPGTADQAKRLKWKAQPDGGGSFAGVISDGEEVYLAVRKDARTGGEVSSYHSRGGKLQWKAPFAATDILETGDLAQGHLLLLQSNLNQTASTAAVISRATGKLTWMQDLAAARPPVVALFDGGVVLGDGRKLTGYVALDPARSQQEATALEAEVQKNPDDPALRLKLAQLRYEAKDVAKAIDLLIALLNDPKLNDDAFATAYDRLARYRKELARTAKPTLTFARTDKPLPCDGSTAAWQQLPAVKLEGWHHLFLAGEADARVAVKRGIWKGPVDLSATFRGAYDGKHLYLCVEVQDDLHKNAQTKPVDLWNGDSVSFGFDPENDKRMGYHGNDAECGIALNDKGAQLGFRWFELGKYTMKPLEAQAKVTRNEERKVTVYQAALPLEALGLKAEPGLKFGFSCLVNDSDDKENYDKGMALSPGLWDPKNPSQYATGELAR